MHNYILGHTEIFTLFFVMLGPLKFLIPFVRATKGLSQKEIQTLSIKATIFGFLSILIGTFIGAQLLMKWDIQPAILALTAGIIFFITAIMLILHLSHPPTAPAADTQPIKATDVVYNMIVTPYGMSAMMILLALSDDSQRTMQIIAIFGAIMLMNLVCMMFIQQLMGKVGLMVMQLLGAVLGVLQAGLAMSMIFKALQLLKEIW
jgi:Multiple antibiotic transporter